MKKFLLIIAIGFACIGFAVFTAIMLDANNEVHGVVTKNLNDRLIFEDEDQVEYIIEREDYKYTENQFKEGDIIFVKFKGEVLEVSPARFKKIVSIKKGKD